MFLLEDETAAVVLFFNDNTIVKEMLYAEFEAILDGFAPDIHWANRDVSACYVEVNNQLHPTAVVFFKVAFDANGWVDAAWNLPLVDLARTSIKGPDMGSGPVHVACQSTCPIQLFYDMLWEPPARQLPQYLQAISRVLARNRLELVFGRADVVGDVPVLTEDLEERIMKRVAKQNEGELKTMLSQFMQDQQRQLATLKGESAGDLKHLKAKHAKRVEQLTRELEETRQILAESTQKVQRYEAVVEQQEKKIEQLREYFQLKLENARTTDSETLSSLKKHYEQETDIRVSAVENEYAELLRLKEVELSYRQERETQLSDEVARLRQQNQELLASSGDNLLKNLSLKGVNFVTYQPGAGHITIPVADMNRFLENPTAFAAAFCDVSEDHYDAWLTHYHAPVCDGVDDNSERCCEDIERVNKPIDFIPGESNLCEKHRNELRREKFTVVKVS